MTTFYTLNGTVAKLVFEHDGGFARYTANGLVEQDGPQGAGNVDVRPYYTMNGIVVQIEITYADGNVARFKCPKGFEFVGNL